MIRVSARMGPLMQRLRVRASRLVAKRAVSLGRPKRTDWHSATALWPDMFGEPRDGK